MLCTLRYSANLGDGALGNCMEFLIGSCQPDRTIIHLDMAGRTSFASSTAEDRSTLMELFYRIPPFFRPLMTRAMWSAKMRKKLNVAWTEAAPAAPFDLVFGGGQMFSDFALNFPLKFNHVAKLALAQGANLAVTSVGVSRSWSGTANKLFETGLTSQSMRYLSVRDADSQTNLGIHLPQLADKCRVTVDPAVWAAEAFGYNEALPKSEMRNKRIGLGISHPKELAAYAPDPKSFSSSTMINFWLELARGLVADGKLPVIFTNGAGEDEAFMSEVEARLQASQIAYEKVKRPLRPAEMVATIASVSSLISHRLHANIIAYSLGVPSVALNWDPKVRAFANVAGRNRWCLDAGASPDECKSAVLRTLDEGVDAVHKQKLKDRARSEVGLMLKALGDY